MKKFNLFTIYSLASLMAVLSLNGISLNLPKNEKDVQKTPSNFHGAKVELYEDTPRYELSDMEQEPQGSKMFSLNYKHMNLGGSSIKDSTVWSYQRGETLTNEKVKVAVIDSGIDIYHEDFLSEDAYGVKLNKDNVLDYSLLSKDSAYFYDPSEGKYLSSVEHKVGILEAYDTATGRQDQHGNIVFSSHGTTVSSVIAGAVNGVGGFGIAPNVELMMIKFDFNFTSLEKAIRYAADCGADVINMSLGAHANDYLNGVTGEWEPGRSDAPYFLQDAIDYAHNKDVVIVASAGNENTSDKSYPAANKGVVGVGALTRDSGTRASFYSNYNGKSDNENTDNNVDIMAPGSVWAANVPFDKYPRLNNTPEVADRYYAETQGTSLSSPLVAGAIALYRAKYPEKNRQEVIDALYDSAVDLQTYDDVKWSQTYGYGKINVAAFLNTDSNRILSSLEIREINQTIPFYAKPDLTMMSVYAHYDNPSFEPQKLDDVKFSSLPTKDIGDAKGTISYQEGAFEVEAEYHMFVTNKDAIKYREETHRPNGEISYSWYPRDQVVAYIRFLKKFKNTKEEWYQRSDIEVLINEYNYMIQDSKNHPMMEEEFTDYNGQKIEPIAKLKKIVSEYNNSLQEGEREIQLEIKPNEHFNGIQNKGLPTFVIIIIVSISVALIIAGGVLTFFLLRKKKTHN